jgi:hypothetical protein
VHLIIDNMADLAEIDRVDDLVVSVLFVAVEILSLTTVPFKGSASATFGEVHVRLPE